MASRDADPPEVAQEILAQMPALLAVACRLTKNRAEAEDLVQDTCLKAVRAWQQYEPGSNLRAWCLKILKNTFINRYRRDGLARSVTDAPTADPVSDGWVGGSTLAALRNPESAALQPMLRQELCRALDSIPEEFRMVVLLADVEELSYREIADVLGCPLGTVMSRLHRGRRQLQTLLAPQAAALGLKLPVAASAVGGEHPAASSGEHAAVDEAAVSAVDLNEFRSRKRGVS